MRRGHQILVDADGDTIQGLFLEVLIDIRDALLLQLAHMPLQSQDMSPAQIEATQKALDAVMPGRLDVVVPRR